MAYAATHSGETFATLVWTGGAEPVELGAELLGEDTVEEAGADVAAPGRH